MIKKICMTLNHSTSQTLWCSGHTDANSPIIYCKKQKKKHLKFNMNSQNQCPIQQKWADNPSISWLQISCSEQIVSVEPVHSDSILLGWRQLISYNSFLSFGLCCLFPKVSILSSSTAQICMSKLTTSKSGFTSPPRSNLLLQLRLAVLQ